MNPGILIRYGTTIYNEHAFEPIWNGGWVKPDGGMWTSPVNSRLGWKQWCEANDFRVDSLQESFLLELITDKILIIDSLDDLMKLPTAQSKIHSIFDDRYLDFELLTKTYDAIWLTEAGQRATHLSQPRNLYGWDCECVLIMNKRCFKVL